KVRSLFRWLTVKNLNKMIFKEQLTEDSPYYFLKGIKYGLESYHELFKRLCSYAGLSVKIIRGISKSAGYKPGMPFKDSKFSNSWASVLIDGDWHFVDCHWGARHVNNTEDYSDPEKFCYSLDEFYFLTNPEDMIYMHYPDEPEWQLLEDPLSVETFVELPVVKSHFFWYGL
ncbi:hypothetical protein CAPTEDRAFT_77697, partial [Capitella teleta]|uniref:Transglutaminase-like domain-containing protein n=1 Tax=Capitella teleta TaxID=283909 RepID=X2B910_CAPTE